MGMLFGAAPHVLLPRVERLRLRLSSPTRLRRSSPTPPSPALATAPPCRRLLRRSGRRPSCSAGWRAIEEGERRKREGDREEGSEDDVWVLMCPPFFIICVRLTYGSYEFYYFLRIQLPRKCHVNDKLNKDLVKGGT